MRPDSGDGEASAQHHGSKLSCRLITEHATSVSQATLAHHPERNQGQALGGSGLEGRDGELRHKIQTLPPPGFAWPVT